MEHVRQTGKRERNSARSYVELLRLNSAAIAQSNTMWTLKLSGATGALFLVMYIASLIAPWPWLSGTYLAGFVSSACVFGFVRLALPKLRAPILPVCYLYIVSMIAVACSIAIFVRPVGADTTFIMVLFLVPVTIIDRAHRMHFTIFVATALYGVLTFVMRPSADYMDRIFQCAVFAALGLFIGTSISRLRVQEIDARRLLVYREDTDQLTGLPNRRKLYKTLELFQSGRIRSRLGIAMIDIDFFKQYNDTLGHQAGDTCLSTLGGALDAFAKTRDVQVYRYGGEEFLLVSGDIAYAELGAMTEELVRMARTLAMPARGITVSVGYAEAGSCNATDYERLISMADSALYHAKHSGRDRAVGYLDLHTSIPDA